MNDVYKYARKLQTTVKLIERIIAGAVAFTLWAVICNKKKSHKKKPLLIFHTFITV
jgi:hypothetical protein